MIGFYDYTVVVTYISLVSSILGMFCAIDGRLTLAVSCLAFSGLCDMFDGKIARTKKNRTDDEKSFGIQIDSLCDIVCFGIFPIILGYKLGMCKAYSIAILAFYGMAGVIRLAYFNVMEAKRQSETSENRKYYQGLPITSMAVIMPLLFVASVFFPGFRYFVGLLHAAMLIVGFLFILISVSASRPIRNWWYWLQLWQWQYCLFFFYKEGWWAHYHTIRKLKGAAA